mmetsp:Transcript_19223/g.47869  ORF Transcript_19223/g.47869 Transcript_19223/m.47869 type:complete len:1517 (-) Transcript_19223:49-4599(-)
MRRLSGNFLLICGAWISVFLIGSDPSVTAKRRMPFAITTPTVEKRSWAKQPYLLRMRGGSSYSDSENENEEFEMPPSIEDDEDLKIETNNAEDDEEEYETLPLLDSQEEIIVSSKEESNDIDSKPGSEDAEDDDEEEYETLPLLDSQEESKEKSNDIDSSSHGSEPNTMSEKDLDDIRAKRRQCRKENRHTSDVILELDRRSSVSGNEESLALRQLITTRTSEYVYELQEEAEHYLEETEAGSDSKVKLPHPRRLLHSLAKNVPAIKQSPDVNLRIHSSRADIDPGVAACIIGRLAFACEQYEQVQKRLTNEYCDTSSYDEEDSEQQDEDNNNNNKSESAGSQITGDRRFEQLVECVISGVNIKKRKVEALERTITKSTDEITTDIEEVLDEEDNHFDEGLNIRDACRAAWGLAILGAHYLDKMGGVKINDLLMALSLRIRELLLARLQLLRQGDILSSGYGIYHQDYDDESQQMRLVTVEERLNELAEELAEDAASAMWAFGCVKACTGMKSVPLFEACCSILCQDPVDLRRRAQEAEYEPEKNEEAIGSSDVVDRLAQSEAAEEGEVELTPNESGGITTENESEIETFPQVIDGKDAFIDWLSPVEVTDILWALALHGSNATSGDKDEVTLSETALTLRETAYDRLVEWLDEDLNYNEEEKSNQETSILETEPLEMEDVTVVEVVDAAALLASEAESSSPSDSATPMKSLDYSEETNSVPVESMSMATSTIVNTDINIQEVEVVDAAKLLASMESGDNESVDVETEVMVAPTAMIEGNSVSDDVDVSYHPQERKTKQIFTPHDLASIAWSVTELRDPLRIHIVGNIIELLWRLGPDGISGLSGTDLANLAWAIAKYEGENQDAYSLSITRWIADQALQRTANDQLLGIFQPPELGRIMWAIACAASTHVSALEDATGHQTSSVFLTRKALKDVSDNLSLFSTETLVRIAWAHLEINHSDLSTLNSFETMALGKILAAAEHSLHRWERVDFAKGVSSVESHVDSPLFSSFFGRSRTNLPILEQAINDDDDEDDMALAPIGRSQRPKLRDLTIDPSTLCKAACGFQRLSKEHPYIKGGWTFTRVAVRLLSSKNARLMKECSIHDIIRLCEAAVLSDVDGHGRELIIGLFARQVVTVLNEVLDDETQHSTSIEIEKASSTEIGTLIWTLGEMGVKYSPGKHAAGKKMRLEFAEPLLQGIRLKSLDQLALERLIRGLVLTKMTSSHQSFVLEVLKRISEIVPNVTKGADLCTLAEAIGILKETSKTNSAKSIEPTEDESQSELVDEEAAEAEEIQNQISIISDQMLNSIASLTIDFAEKLTANEIRRLLEVYSLLPFQADATIACLSDEVSNRLEALEDLRKDTSLITLMKNASQKVSVVKSSLFDDSNTSFFDSMRVKFFSLFRSSNDDGNDDDEVVHQIDDEGTKLTEEIVSVIQDSISATSNASRRANMDQTTLKIPLDRVIQNLEEGASFELGRSSELIENYHRTEFATGERRSRYDKDRKNYIAKRVLSRLLP